MAIKAKGTVAEIQLPEELNELLKKGFTEQQLKSHYEDMFKETKEIALKLVEASSEVTLEVGTALKSKFGSINIVETNRPSIDKDKLIELVESGKVSIVDVLQCVSTFKNDDLEKAISTKLFSEIATDNVGKSFTWKISPEFKRECEEIMGEGPLVIVEKAKPIVAKAVVKPVVEKPKTAKEKVQAASAKLKSLDDILKG